MKKFFIIFGVLVLLGFLFDPGLTLTILMLIFGIPIGLILIGISGLFFVVFIVLCFIAYFKIIDIWQDRKKQQIEYQIIFSGDYLIGQNYSTTYTCMWKVMCSKAEAERNVSKWRTNLPEEWEVPKIIYKDTQKYKTRTYFVRYNIAKLLVIRISQ